MLGPGVDTAAPSAPPRPRHVGERGPRGAGLSPTAPVQATPGDTQTQAHKVKKGRERLRGPRGAGGLPRGGGERRAPGATGTKSRRSPAEEAPRFPVCPRASPLTPRVPVCPRVSPCVPAHPARPRASPCVPARPRVSPRVPPEAVPTPRPQAAAVLPVSFSIGRVSCSGLCCSVVSLLHSIQLFGETSQCEEDLVLWVRDWVPGDNGGDLYSSAHTSLSAYCDFHSVLY